MRTWAGGRMRRGPAITSVAVAVVVICGVVAAITLTGNHQSFILSRRSGSPTRVASLTSPFKAVANVTPPVAVSMCRTPTVFIYRGMLSATEPGTVRYQWVYSSGRPGAVRAVRFTTAGHKAVAGATVRPLKGGGGWGEIRIISPVARTSKKAAYKLLCGGSAGGITATAAVEPASRTVSCATAPPAFTATGSISAVKAETVTYYWAQSDGANSAPANLTFTKPGTQPVKPLTIRPPAASGTGNAVLVVTSPVTAASRPATYMLACTSSKTSPTVAGGNPPPTTPAGSGGISPPPLPPDLVVTVNAPAIAYLGLPYSGTVTVTGGEGPYHWGAASGLPPGLTANPNGATLTISGTPTDVDTSWVPAGPVSDSYQLQQTVYWEVRITVDFAPVTITCPASQATAGQPYVGTLTATGGDGTPFTWSVLGIPPGLTGTADGGTYTISGTPAATDVITTTSPPTPGRYELDVTVSDSQTSFGRTCDFPVNP